MARTLVTDLTHFLTKEGAIAPMPGPARRLAEFLGKIVIDATTPPSEQFLGKRVKCTRRPGSKKWDRVHISDKCGPDPIYPLLRVVRDDLGYRARHLELERPRAKVVDDLSERALLRKQRIEIEHASL